MRFVFILLVFISLTLGLASSINGPDSHPVDASPLALEKRFISINYRCNQTKYTAKYLDDFSIKVCKLIVKKRKGHFLSTFPKEFRPGPKIKLSVTDERYYLYPLNLKNKLNSKTSRLKSTKRNFLIITNMCTVAGVAKNSSPRSPLDMCTIIP
ncbi:hypothetical protein K3495_g7355 [Podosphaera aphanis]|nr:hypothetical protein K3495_g7355 [Podosphaera aphanis]